MWKFALLTCAIGCVCTAVVIAFQYTFYLGYKRGYEARDGLTKYDIKCAICDKEGPAARAHRFATLLNISARSAKKEVK